MREHGRIPSIFNFNKKQFKKGGVERKISFQETKDLLEIT